MPCRGSARCRGNPASCRPTAVWGQTAPAGCCSARPNPAPRSRADRQSRPTRAHVERRATASLRSPLLAAVLVGVVLQAALAFEAAVFENLLLLGHPLQREAHLDRFDEDGRV